VGDAVGVADGVADAVGDGVRVFAGLSGLGALVLVGFGVKLALSN
jgi:hypothetical protein